MSLFNLMRDFEREALQSAMEGFGPNQMQRILQFPLINFPFQPDPFPAGFGFGGFPAAPQHVMQEFPPPPQGGAMYMSSSVTSITRSGGRGAGPPRVYQSTTATTQVGSHSQTTRTLQDTATGVKKMSLTRRVGDQRVYTKERRDNLHTGRTELEVEEGDPDAPDFHHSFLHHGSRSRPRSALLPAPSSSGGVTIEEIEEEEPQQQQRSRRKRQRRN